jgi:hypothetical protein
MRSPAENRYIFCVSPGRSGTHYLQRVFECSEDVCAVHEPEHQYSEYADLKPRLWDLKNTPFSSTTDERRRAKLRQIHDLLGKSGHATYAETNPLFSTLWHDVILEALSDRDVTVVILRRDATAVLKSLLDLGWFQGKDGNRWMVTAYSINSLVKPHIQERYASAADLIIGYLMNVECYAQHIKHRCAVQGHRVIELDSQQLFTDEHSIDALAGECGLALDQERLKELNRTSQNKPSVRRKVFDTPIGACRTYIDNFLDIYKRKDISVPYLYHS